MEGFTTNERGVVGGSPTTRRRRTFASTAAVIAAAALTLVATSAGAAVGDQRCGVPGPSTPLRWSSTRPSRPLGTILVTRPGYTLYYDKSDTARRSPVSADAPRSGRRCCSPAVSTPRQRVRASPSALGVVHRPGAAS